MTLDLQQIAEFALNLAQQAGDLIQRERQAAKFEWNYKNNAELVTSADVKVDRLIRDAIQANYPDHLLLSEELAPQLQDPKSLHQPIWVVDPIDGTVNFAHGHRQVAVCIAFALGGEVQVGVVHCPFLDETFHAIRGLYSRLNEQDLAVSGLDHLRSALVATGFPYDKTQLPPLFKRLQAVLAACQDIRRVGSAAIDICWVAMGRLDGYYESLSPWDFAAARLIALEAGASCGHLYDVPEEIPEELYGRDILISTPALFQPLKALLLAADQTD